MVGCALYVEVLSILSLALQGSEIDIVLAIKQICQCSQVSYESIQWPAVKQVLDRIKDDHDEKMYQGTALSDATLQQEAMSDLKKLSENILKRLEWSDRALLVFFVG